MRRIVVKSDKKKKASLVWFLEWQSKYFSSLICFFLFLVWLDKTAECFSSLFCFISFFLSWRDWDNKRAENFSSLYCFSSFLFALYLLYYAQDSCKKWQEKEGKLGPISRMERFKYFSSLFLFFLLFLVFGETGSVRIGQLNISRHFFVLFLFTSLKVTNLGLVG